jgi:hypothetical protein
MQLQGNSQIRFTESSNTTININDTMPPPPKKTIEHITLQTLVARSCTYTVYTGVPVYPLIQYPQFTEAWKNVKLEK